MFLDFRIGSKEKQHLFAAKQNKGHGLQRSTASAFEDSGHQATYRTGVTVTPMGVTALTYGCEKWVLWKQDNQRIQATEMMFLR